jgi:hypothetical protein
MAISEDLIKKMVQERLTKGPQAGATETGDADPGAETVIGWRAWRIPRQPALDEEGNPEPVYLRSASYDYFWVPLERARASCDTCGGTDPNDRETTPGEGCTCGFYTARSLPHLRKMGYHKYNEEYDGDITVVGKVANWGKVIEGSQGWRAEYAYPLKLYLPYEGYRVGKAISDLYGVPLSLMNILDDAAKPDRKRKLHDFEPEHNRTPKFLRDYRRKHGGGDEEDWLDE